MPNNQKWIIANWKMQGSLAQITHFLDGLTQGLQRHSPRHRWIFCPPAPYLSWLVLEITKRGLSKVLSLGAQNCHTAEKGAFTGEISAWMLKELGIQSVLLGHSERRAYQGETSALVAEKTLAALSAGIMPIICLGETAAEREQGDTQHILKTQWAPVHTALSDKQLLSQPYLLAYEPRWAIGTGKTPTIHEIVATHQFIASQLGQVKPILYGGSVTAENAGVLLAEPTIGGVLVGGASLDPVSFWAIDQSQ